MITGKFYGTSPDRMKYIERGDLYGCVAENFKFFREFPDFIHFYNLTRLKKSPIQEKLIEIENGYQITALQNTIHGAVGSHILNQKSFEIVFKSMNWPYITKRSKARPLN